MKKIAIDFHNMWPGFFKRDNIIINTLKKEYEVEISSDPDIVVCQHTSYSGAAHITHTFRGRSKIVHWHTEAFDRIGLPNYNHCDFSISSCKHEHPNNIRIPLWSMYVDWFDNPYVAERNQAFLVSPQKLLEPKVPQKKTKFCCVLTNNGLGYRGVAYPAFLEFSADNDLLTESRGKFLRNCPPLDDNGYNEKSKLTYIRDFKFNLCYDNTDVDGWVTEKLIHPMYEGVIPIYWGAKDVIEEFNEDGFVHVRNFDSLEHLHNCVLEINNNDDLFTEIQTQPCFPHNRIPDIVNPDNLIEQLKAMVEA